MNKTYLSIYKKKKIIVTGSTGFKGAWLCFWLNMLGARVVGIGLKPEKNSILFSKLKLNKKIKQYFFDINNLKKLKNIIKKEKPKFIFHLAAQSIVSESYSQPINTFKTNILGSANILECCRKLKVPNLLLITSDKCYLNLNLKKNYRETDKLGGIDNYSSSKASAENIFFSYHNSYFKNSKYLGYASARAGNVIGGGDLKKDRIVPDIIKSIKFKKNLLIRNPKSTRPWQHVLEPLSGYLLLGYLLIKKKLPSNIYPSWNFGPHSRNSKKVKDLVLGILKNINRKTKIKFNTRSKFYESSLLSLNIEKAKKELGWYPTLSFNETLKFTSLWYENFLKKKNLEQITKIQIQSFTSKMKIKKFF